MFPCGLTLGLCFLQVVLTPHGMQGTWKEKGAIPGTREKHHATAWIIASVFQEGVGPMTQSTQPWVRVVYPSDFNNEGKRPFNILPLCPGVLVDRPEISSLQCFPMQI